MSEKALGLTKPHIPVPLPAVVRGRAPTAADSSYVPGRLWIHNVSAVSKIAYIYGGTGVWTMASPGASDIDTINGLAPVAGNVIVDGGTNITDVNVGNTVTINLDAAITLATSVTAPLFTSAAAMDINAAAGSNITIQMGDAIGVNVIDFEDSASATVAAMNSVGTLTVVNMDGIIGATTPAAITGTTLVANTSVSAPIYTSAAGTDTEINSVGGQNIVIQMGDAIGANVIDFEDSASATVATMDSDGTLTVVNMDGIIGATTPAAITGTTIVGNTSVSSILYTVAAADLAITAAAGQDVDIQLGDAIGGNELSINDSAGVPVWTLDSNGVMGVFAGAVIAGVLTQTGGAVNIGMDNLGSAINIGGGNVIKALAIGGGAAAHTIAIGGVAAGAVTLDTAAGISLDAVTASNITVTGAADLTIASTAGGVDLTSGEAAANAISLDATDGAGGITLAAGTGGLLLGNQADCTTLDLGNLAPTAARTTTVGGGTVVTIAVTDTIDIGPDGATTNANSIKTVNVNTGGVAIGEVNTHIASGVVTSGTHLTEIASGNRVAGTATLNISTGTGTKVVNAGNADGLTTVNIDAITLINDDIDVATSINTGTSTGTVTVGNGAAGAMTIDTAAGISLDAATASNFTVTGAANLTLNSTAGNVIIDGGVDVTIDSGGVLELNSNTGIIGIGNDADAFNINVGTGGAARVITAGNVTGATSVVVDVGTGAATFGASATVHATTLGSVTGASATTIQSGTGDIIMTGTVKEATTEFVTRSGDYIVFTQSPLGQSNLNTGVDPTGANGDVNLLSFQEGMLMEQFIIGTQTIVVPRMDATGLLSSLDLTATDGWELNFGAARANSRHSYTIGTSLAFFCELRFTLADVSGCEPLYFGFRRTQANNAAFANYTDFVGYGVNNLVAGGDCVIGTQLNTGGINSTDTNDAFGDGTTQTLQVLVSAAGVVTFTFNGGAPTATQAFTFDAGDVVHPYIHNIMGAGAPGNIHFQWLKVGYQA